MTNRGSMINKVRWISAFILTGLILVALSGCSSAVKGLDQSAAPNRTEVAETGATAATQAPPTETFTLPPPTATSTATATLAPTDTSTPVPTATETPPPPTPSGDQAVYIYLVQTGTGGPVACGDSLIKVNTGLPRSGDNATDISAALRRLLVKQQWMVGLYNPAYLSNMSVASVDFNSASGLATVDLIGTYVRSGDHCDDGRVHDQIWTTIRQFPGVKGILVRLNGNLLGDILSTSPGREGKPEKKKP